MYTRKVMRVLILVMFTYCCATPAFADFRTPPPLALQTGTAPQGQDSGIPTQMKAGASTPVAVTLRNTGSRSWSSTGNSPVRLVVRWVDAATNIRSRWAVQWLRGTVEPGQSAEVAFNLKAPPRAGQYILTYALVRLSEKIYDGKNYTPPPAKAQDQRWPGEFGAVNFEIQVTP